MTKVKAVISAKDHPRVGGGTQSRRRYRHCFPGPSPRGRGNPKAQNDLWLYIGTIPAWAGEPCSPQAASIGLGDHPRVGGGTDLARNSDGSVKGPSPRGRGNPNRLNGCSAGAGTIPAWAGEPNTLLSQFIGLRDHPRVGGGTANHRMGHQLAKGPSPRGRGNLCNFIGHELLDGTIPAWAGEPI